MSTHVRIPAVILFWVAGWLCSPCAFAAEEILSFDSRIAVQADGSLKVQETIRVRVEGNEIRRGIYRDFPTLYRGAWGLRVEVPFRVESVFRDGKTEPWRQERRGNGVRVYFGSEDVLLPHGETTYVFRYSTSRQLGFFESFDELYWNVTGNGWALPILSASACVILPPGAWVKSVESFTGPTGSRATDALAERRAGCDAWVRTTRSLAPGEGFTIVVTWQKGVVSPPGEYDQLREMLVANKGVAMGIVGLLVAAAYFLSVWWLHGRDPERGVIVPLYGPPEGLTPQDVRYLRGLGKCDDRSFASAVLHLAVQGALRITQSEKKVYSLHQGEGKASGEGERRLIRAIFRDGSPLTLISKNYQTIQAARKELVKILKETHAGAYQSNTKLWVVGLCICLIPLGISLFDANEIGGAAFMLLWLGFWSLGCGALAVAVGTAWRSGYQWSAIPITLFSLPFFAGWVFGFWALMMAASLWVSLVYLAAVLLCMVFLVLLKQPTPATQLVRDQIEGFREYLSVGESDRLALENPPERTPELFEKFLPYALALDVEQAWAEKFSYVLEAAGYDPGWYDGRSTSRIFAAGAFANTVGVSLAGAIGSSSSPPGSRSGSSSGGGSSGGGGGGGGGGGW
ncbi:MAG: DUF2207 domain-containing protein [Terrimicrobiaceae bacterium]